MSHPRPISPVRSVRPLLSALAVVGCLATTACGAGTDVTSAGDGVPVPSGTASSTSTAPSTTASAPTSPPSSTAPTSPVPTSPGSPSAPTAADPDTTQAAIYWVGRTPRGTRLVSELRDVASGDPLAGAAAVLTTGAPLDPDYTSLVPSTLTVTSVRMSDGRIIVQVGADSPVSPDKGTSPRDAALAVQQIVYTLQAVSGTRAPVQVVQGDGGQEVPTRLYGQDTVTGVKAQPQLKVLALVNVTSPQDGAVVTGDTMKVGGRASSFEANVPWSVRRGGASGRVVASGAATASGYLGRLWPWSTDVDVSALAPGDYTFVATTDEPSGKEGSRATVDTKSFTLQ